MLLGWKGKDKLEVNALNASNLSALHLVINPNPTAPGWGKGRRIWQHNVQEEEVKEVKPDCADGDPVLDKSFEIIKCLVEKGKIKVQLDEKDMEVVLQRQFNPTGRSFAISISNIL